MMPAPATPDSMAAPYARRTSSDEQGDTAAERRADPRAMAAWLTGRFSGRRMLELACRTGWWTPHGAADAAHRRATDLNPEAMAVAPAKPAMPASVCVQTVDACTLAGPDDEPFDAAFAGCWWSHAPLNRLPAWLARLNGRLLPGATVVAMDNRLVPGSSTPISRSDAEGNPYPLRSLDDGSRHAVLKNCPTADQAIAALGRHVRDPQWTVWPHSWALSGRVA